MSSVEYFGELNIRQVNASVIYSALNEGAGVGERRSLTLTCAKDDNSSQLSLTLHHDDDGGGGDTNTATFSSNTQIKGVLDPTDNQDVATKSYVLANAGGGNDHTVTDTDAAVVSTAVTLKHNLSSGVHTIGIGTGMNFVTETTAGDEIGMSLTSVSTNVGATTEDFDFVLNLMSGGATANEALRVTSDKILTIPSTGDIFLPDGAELRMGNTVSTPDATIKHDGSELLIFNETGSTGHMILWNKANSGANRDILMRLNDDTGSSGLHIQNNSGNNILTVASDSETTCRKRTTVNNGHATPLFIYGKYTGGGSPASGMGTSIKFSTDLTDTDNHNIGTIIFQTEEDTAPATPGDTTNAKLNTKILLHNYKGGTVQRVLKINNDGILEIGNNTGDATLNTQSGDLILSTEDTAACKIERDGSKTYIASETGALELITKTGTTDRASIFMEDGTTGDISIDAGDDSTSQTSKVHLKCTDHIVLQHRNHTAVLNTTYKAADFEVINLSGTGAVGGGVYVDFSVELSDSSGWPREIGKIEYFLQTDATQASRDSSVNLYNYKSGSEKRVLQIDKDGIFTVGNDITACTIKSQTSDLILSSASDKLCRLMDDDGSLQIDGPLLYKKQSSQSLTTLNSGINLTYDNTTMLGGVIIRDCNGATRNDVIATGKQTGTNGAGLVVNIPNVVVGTTFELTICNISSVGEDLYINTADNSGIVKGANCIKAGENMKFTSIVRNTTANSEVYDLFSYGSIIPSIPIGAGTGVNPYIFTINQNTNHTWTPAELYKGYARRISTSNRVDVLPNAGDFLTAYPTLKIGDIIELEILKTGTGRVRMATSADGTFVGFGGGGTFTSLSTRNQQVNNNWTMKFSIIIYEIGATPKIDILRMTRN